MQFSSSFFSANRAALRQKLGPGLIVISGNGLVQRTADTTLGFQQDSNAWYLTGIELPDITLVMTDIEQYVIVPGRSDERAAFDGAIDESQLQEISGLGDVVDSLAGWKRLKRDIAASSRHYMTMSPPAYDDRHGFYTNPARVQTQLRLKRIARDWKDCRTALAELRCIKQPAELAALQQAIDITARTLTDIHQKLQANTYEHEYQIEADISHGFRRRGGRGHAFEPIVANGKRATTLHNIGSLGPIDPSSLTICDVGSEVGHYAADITRTMSTGRPSDRQRAVYDAVRDSQRFALNLLKPGTLLAEYEAAVAEYLGKHLQRLGLITTLSHEAIRAYYPHATSHFLGLDVHDVGDYRKPLAAGMVITCEPGIYIPEEAIGVRIEDNVLITETGNRVLSASCPELFA